MNLSDFLAERHDYYKLDNMGTSDCKVYDIVKHIMYRLLRVGILVHEKLEKCLSKHGYIQITFTLGDVDQ